MSNPRIASRFDEIYNSTNKDVLGFITAKCGRVADINDIFQETYMELYKVLNERGAKYVEHDKAFVLRIAKHKIAKHYSLMERLRIFVSMTSVNDDEDEIDLSDFNSDNFLSEDFTVNYVLIEIMQQFLDSKPDIVQKVFYLMYDVGLTIPEIAQALSMSESNVKNKLYRTLRELRILITEETN